MGVANIHHEFTRLPWEKGIPHEVFLLVGGVGCVSKVAYDSGPIDAAIAFGLFAIGYSAVEIAGGDRYSHKEHHD